MKVVIAGGTGLIGKHLIKMLLTYGHEIIILSRSIEKRDGQVTYIKWLDGSFPEEKIKQADVVINLAGASINAGRWTKEHQQRIYDSRMKTTEELARIAIALPQRPALFLNASAIGIYPPSFESTYTEASEEKSSDFLGTTVQDWENKVDKVKVHGIRTIAARFGVILDKKEGALPLMALPYKVFAGGTVGSGKQWVSWIHILDVVRALMFLIDTDEIKGAVNITAPNPVQMKEFGETIAATLKRPHWLPAPALILKIALGQKSALVLEGQRVLPSKLLAHGFQFKYATLKTALEDLL